MIPFTPERLATGVDLLPPIACELIEVIGVDAACALLNARPGCTFAVPLRGRNKAGARRWEEIAAIIGEDAMQAFVGRWGGSVIDIPTCHALRVELRRRAIRADFDRLTRREKLSGKAAIYEIGLCHAPITSRAIEGIVNRADAGRVAAQGRLF